jgi:hypothetical protein
MAFVVTGPFETMACQALKRGHFWSHDELIDAADVIVLATVKRVKNVDALGTTRDVLQVIESLKGKARRRYVLTGWAKSHYSTDFALHTDSAFWQSDTGRAPFLGGMCRPAFTFRQDETYLLFPDALGSMKAAEIVRSNADKWYKYVVSRIACQKDCPIAENERLKSRLIGSWQEVSKRASPDPRNRTAVVMTINRNTIQRCGLDRDVAKSDHSRYIVAYGRLISPNLTNETCTILFLGDTLCLVPERQNTKPGISAASTEYYFLRTDDEGGCP